MGRKIPGKRHKKVKDPNVQRGNRLAELKNKINNPPGKEDVQEVPKSALRIMELKEKAKNYILEKKNGKKRKFENQRVVFDVSRALGKEIKLPGMDRPDRYIPDMKQGPHESVTKFAERVHHVCDDVLKEVRFEEKFGVEVKRNETGKITEVKQIKSQKRSKKPKLCDKRKERELKKVNSRESPKEFAKLDTFEFGDIVHQPPTGLKFPGKNQQNLGDPNVKLKPGKRNLLLKEVLNGENIEKTTAVSRKKLTTLEKQKQEKRRKLVVEAFRKAKKEKSLI